MKSILLIRHAKSSWDAPHLPDFERPLNDRGIDSIRIMGELISKKREIISHFFASSAARAHATGSGLVQKIGQSNKDLSFHKELYHASVSDLLQFTCRISNEMHTVALVGHNPGLTDYFNYLVDNYIDNIPTCGIVKINLNIKEWKEVTKSCGRLEYFEFPKGQD